MMTEYPRGLLQQQDDLPYLTGASLSDPSVRNDPRVQDFMAAMAQMMQQPSQGFAHLYAAADQPTPFGPPSSQAGTGLPQQQMYQDFAGRSGRPEWFGGQQWPGPMRMMPGTQGSPANSNERQTMLQQMMRLYGLA